MSVVITWWHGRAQLGSYAQTIRAAFVVPRARKNRLEQRYFYGVKGDATGASSISTDSTTSLKPAGSPKLDAD